MPILLSNGWLTGTPVPERCSSGNSPDFLDTETGQLFTCINGKYEPLANTGSGSAAFTSRFLYRADTSTGQSDPGKGLLRWNNTVQIDATQLFVDRLTQDGLDTTLQFLLMGPASRFVIQEQDFALNYQLWEVTTPGVVLADFFSVGCHLLASHGQAQFSVNTKILVLR
jgi:hypothetical protein